MKIVVDENNIITGYTALGDIAGSIVIDDLPEDFEATFLPNRYLYMDGTIQLNSDFIQPQSRKVRNKIAELKSRLADTDYKIIKCYEYSLVGKPLPYDVAQLHNEKQAIRDEINSFSGLIG